MNPRRVTVLRLNCFVPALIFTLLVLLCSFYTAQTVAVVYHQNGTTDSAAEHSPLAALESQDAQRH